MLVEGRNREIGVVVFFVMSLNVLGRRMLGPNMSFMNYGDLWSLVFKKPNLRL